MKRFALAFAAMVLMAGPAFAQSNVRIVGRSSDGIDRPVLTTTDGRLQVDSNAAGGAGTDPRVAQGATTSGQTGSLIQCAVVSGDQSYTAGTVQPCTLTASGRLKVGLSSATNIAPGAAPSTTLAGDLVSCVYRTPVSWTIGWQGAVQCDSAGNLMVSGNVGITGTLPAFASTPTFNIGTIGTAATAAKQDTLIAQTKSLSQAATSTSANVTAATSSTTLLAANANRLGGAIVNDSTAVLYIKLSATASSTSYDYYLAGSSSGVPAQFEIPANWTGPVYGIWASVNGSARVSERTQ